MEVNFLGISQFSQIHPESSHTQAVLGCGKALEAHWQIFVHTVFFKRSGKMVVKQILNNKIV